MNNLFVKTGDTVMVMSGEDKGKTGKVQKAYPSKGKIVVEGVAMVKKHQKARNAMQPGGIIHKELAIDASNVMIVCPKCGKATRVAHKVSSVNGERKMVRTCKKCNAEID